MANQNPFQEYLNALGRATHSWAVLEMSTDFIIAVIYQAMGGKTKHHQFIPKELGRKIAYLKAVGRLKSVEPFKERIRAHRMAIKKLGDKRHTAIHGAALAFDKDGMATVHQVLHLKTIHSSKTSKSSAGELLALANETITLSHDALALVIDLAAHVGLNVGEKPAG